MTRLIDLPPSSLEAVRGADLVDSIRGCEGRVVAAETVCVAAPLIDKLSNPEILRAHGADIVALNLYDVTRPQVMGMPNAEGVQVDTGFGFSHMGIGRTAGDVARWAGVIPAINLEPFPDDRFPQGRRATAENAARAADQGVAIIVVTANPGTGVTMEGIAEATEAMRAATGDRVVYLAGRMHAAGLLEPVMSPAHVATLASAGAHGVVLPGPMTTPGMTLERCVELVDQAHASQMLAWNSIGTSQEGASTSVIEQIALASKASGADIHHIGDAGFFGIAPPENVYAYSIALRGRRHTWFRMAASGQR